MSQIAAISFEILGRRRALGQEMTMMYLVNAATIVVTMIAVTQQLHQA
jgi:hypothetical protein